MVLWGLGDFLGLARETADLLRAEGLDVGVVNPRYIKPLDRDLLAAQARRARVIASLENGVVRGGFGSLLGEELLALRFPGRFLPFGWPNAFIAQGAPADLRARHGLTAPVMAEAIRRALAS